MTGDWNKNMETLANRKRLVEVKETLDYAIWEWYTIRGLPVPNWRRVDDQTDM